MIVLKKDIMHRCTIFVVVLMLGRVSVADELLPKIKPVSVTTIEGQEMTIGGKAVGKPTVLVFITPDCPVANSYMPHLERISAECWPLGFQMALIHCSTTDEQKIRKHIDDYKITIPIVVDADQSIAKSVRAKVTPEAFIIDSAGQVLYRGRIDDRLVGYGKRRVAATRDDLREAILEVSQSKTVSVPQTPAVGCIIHYK